MIGKLNMYVEPGTIMGPTSMGELVTAHETSLAEDGGYGIPVTTFRHAQTKDFQNVQEPRSVTEHAMMQVQPSIFGPVRSTEVIEYHRPADVGKVYGGEIIPAKLIRGEGRNGR